MRTYLHAIPSLLLPTTIVKMGKEEEKNGLVWKKIFATKEKK